MKKKTIEVKPPETFPEVLEYMDARAALDEFKADNAAVFEQLSQLVERHNAALEQAEKVVRQQGVKCGPFDAYQVSVKYDAGALYNAIGRDLFLLVGGTISTETVYGVDRGRLEAAITTPNSKVTDEVVKVVRKENVIYHVPARLVTP